MIFVFGSNLKGIHGAGAALFAREYRGAIMGQGLGLQGDSWAIPTCSVPGVPLPLSDIKTYVDIFLEAASYYATQQQYQVTRIGCGLAGYTDDDIAPMFKNSPDNVWLPASFARALYMYGLKEGR